MADKALTEQLLYCCLCGAPTGADEEWDEHEATHSAVEWRNLAHWDNAIRSALTT